MGERKKQRESENEIERNSERARKTHREREGERERGTDIRSMCVKTFHIPTLGNVMSLSCSAY